jgi:dihydropteroate synthase
MLDAPKSRALDARGHKLPIGGRTLIMGVVNVTPDSFSDGGRYPTADAAIAAGLGLVREGADMVDVGGESTRPGHAPVDAEAELARVLPVIAGLAAGTAAPISVDTSKATVAEAALKAGACIVNDVWGLARDPDMAAVVAAHDAAAVIMHNREEVDPGLDILAELSNFFSRSLDRAAAAGIRPDRIVLDPGIGFGKTLEQNLTILAQLETFGALGFPILIGVSRKSFIAKLSPSEPHDRLPGTIAANVIAALAGAAIVRVHDVAAHVQALRITEAIRGAGQ